MPSFDNRIVSLKFDNAQFEKGVQTTSTTVGKFEKLIGKLGAPIKGNFNQIGGAVAEVQSRFTAFDAIVTGALFKIGNAAVSLAAKLANTVFAAPRLDGFAEYEQKIGSVQTILANTAKYGTTIDDVTKSLAALNEYSDKTIYNFSDMTRNIGLFTNAGIKLEDATSMIKGFSNAAAASGTNAQQAAGAAYQLSQALSAGTIRLMDWRSLTNAGMGSKNMQEGIIQIAQAMGTFAGSGTDAANATRDFNGSLEKGWLTADVMSTYLKIMAGDMDEAAMASIGLSTSQIESLKLQQKTAEEAATKIRTFTALVGTIKEELGSSWAETFELIFGNFEEATKLWSGLHDGISKIINRIGDSRNEMLRSWKDLGGRERLFEALSKAGNALVAVFDALAKAWEEVFPPMTGKKLAGITDAFVKLIEFLTPAPKTIENIAKAFKVVITPIRIIIKAIGAAIFVAFKLVQPFLVLATKGVGAFFRVIDSVVSFIRSMKEAIVSSYLFTKGIEAIKNAVAEIKRIFNLAQTSVTEFINSLKNSLNGINPFDGFVHTIKAKINEAIGIAKERGLGFKDTLVLIAKNVYEEFKKAFNIIKEKGFNLKDVATKMVEEFSTEFKTKMTALKGMAQSKWNEFSDVASQGASATGKVAGSAFGNFVKVVSTLYKALKTTVAKVKEFVDSLLGASSSFTSFIDTSVGRIEDVIKPVRKASSDFEEAFARINGSQVKSKGPSIFEGAAAVAMAGLARFSWEMGNLIKSFRTDLIKPIGESIESLGGVLEGFQKRLKAQALKTIAVAIVILVGALFLLSQLDAVALAQGVGGLAGVMIMLSASMKVFSIAIKSISAQELGALAASLITLGGAVLLFAFAIKILGGMDLGGLAKGLLGFMLVLGAVSVFMRAVPKEPTSVAGIIGLATAMTILAGAIRLFGTMELGTIATGLGTMAAALIVLSVAVKMVGAIGPMAAASLALLSSSLIVMAGAFAIMSAIPWKNLAKSLIFMTGTLLVLAGLSVGLSSLTSAMSALALVILAFGAGVALIGVGLLAAATSLLVLSAGLTALSLVAPAAAIAISTALLTMVNGIMDAFEQLINRFTEMVPVLANLLVTMIDSFLAALVTKIPSITQSAVEIISGFVVGLLTGLSTELPRMVNAAFDFIIAFINTMSTVIVERGPEVLTAIAGLAGGILRGLWNGIKGVGSVIADWGRKIIKKIAGLGSQLWDSAKEAGKNIIDGIKNAITNGVGAIGRAMTNLASKAWSSFKSFLGINSPSKLMYSGGLFMVQGLTNGINDNAKKAEKASENMGKRVSESVIGIVDEINNAFENDFDLEPTITPVLDMSNVRSGAAKMKGLLNDPLSVSRNNLAASANSFGRYQNGSTSYRNTQSISFVQNNYSPKALSRIDIYRQTNTQLSQLRSVPEYVA